MNKSDLRSGHILETEDGRKWMVLRNSFFDGRDRYFVIDRNGSTCYGNLEYVDSNLKSNGQSGNIEKVYKPQGNLLFPIEDTNLTLLWERKPSIDIDVFINGEEANLSDISKETLLSLRDGN